MPSKKATSVNTKRSSQKHVQFWIEPALYDLLAEKAKADKSVGAVASSLLIDALAREGDEGRMREQLVRMEGRIEERIENLNRRLSDIETRLSKHWELVFNATQTLLVAAGKMTAEEAAAWKKAKFRSE